MRILVLALLCAATGRADVITFEDQPDQTNITTQYAGLTFTNATILTAGISLNEFEFPPHSGTNVIFDDNGPITITFDTPVLSVGAYLTYATPVTLTAYSATNAPLGTVMTSFASNMALSGDAASSANEFLGISSQQLIARLTLTGAPQGGSFVVDDLTNTVSTVPEPSSALLVGTAAAVWIRKIYKDRTRRGSMRTVQALIVLGFLLSGCQLDAAPSIGTVNVTPTYIHTGSPQTITVTALITDPTVIPTSVNLLRLSTSGTTIVGQLRDDGANGDAAAGDKIFSGRTIISEAAEGQLRLQVSAAFKGTLARSTSTVLTVPVSLTGLPPDPGPVGKLSVEGIDLDQDGVRDDVQRYIAFTYPASPSSRAALTQTAKAFQTALLSTSTQSEARNVSRSLHAGIACILATIPNGSSAYDNLTSELLNTEQRLLAFDKYNALLDGQVFGVPEQACT